jgi:hypothetical protein
MHITTMFDLPRLLQNADVPVSTSLKGGGIRLPASTLTEAFMVPNMGGCQLCSYDWTPAGSDANERYRSFAHDIFSHDRLTFTMANHLGGNKTPVDVQTLLDELEHVVVEEELRLRKTLAGPGVRDVSTALKNRLDQLGENNYQLRCHSDWRLLLLSVACRYSQSEDVFCRLLYVSATDRKYFALRVKGRTHVRWGVFVLL